MMSLYALCARVVEEYFINGAKELLEQESTSNIDIFEQTERCYLRVRDVPTCLHAEIAARCLKAAKRLSSFKFSSSPCHEFAVQQLVSIVVRLKPKKMTFYIESSHNDLKIFYSPVFKSLKEMNQLQKLEFHFLRNYSFSEGIDQLIGNCPAFINLVSFICNIIASDQLVKAMCENCNLLQEVALTSSKEVTNVSIASLCKCEQLRKVCLSGTSVSEEGLADLLRNSANLVNIAYIDDVNKLLSLLENDVPFRTFQLQNLYYCTAAVTKLHLVNAFFPYLNRVDMRNCNFKDLTPHLLALDEQKNARKATLLVEITLEMPDSAILSLKSNVLTCIELHYDRRLHDSDLLSVKITTIMSIGLQCPNVETLDLNSLSFIDDTDSEEFYPLLGKCFLKLRKFSAYACRHEFALRHILCYAFNSTKIEMIDGDVTDEFFNNVMDINPFERLKVMYVESKNISPLILLKPLITHCKKLSSLSLFGNIEIFAEVRRE